MLIYNKLFCLAYTSLAATPACLFPLSFSNLLLLKPNMFAHCPQRQLLYSGYCKFAQVVFPTGMTSQLFFVLQIVQKLLFKFHLFWPVCAIPELFLLWIPKASVISMPFFQQSTMDHSGTILLHCLVLLLDFLLYVHMS